MTTINNQRGHWHCGFNRAGCLPEAEPSLHDSFEDARAALAEEMESHAAGEATWADEHNCGDIPCPAYGDSCGWQRAAEIRSTRDDLLDATTGADWQGVAVGLVYWVTLCDDQACAA